MALLLSLIKAIPALRDIFERLVSLYIQSEISSMKSENLNAVRMAITEHDQRDLEKAIGSPTAGIASGDPGSVIIDHPPGVHKP
jgi:hypothetical protein